MTIIPSIKTISLAAFLNIAVFLNLGPNPAWGQPSVIELMEQHKNSIVAIQAQKVDTSRPANPAQMPVLEKTGAGIIIDAAGYIVTNTHTILYADYIFATLNDGTRLPAAIASVAPNSDFSILKIDSPVPLQPLPWSAQNAVLGADIISIENSPLWKKTICGGRITGIANKLSENTVALFETDLELERGDSGGPVFDRDGNFLGIIIAKNTKAARSGFAIPSAEIRGYFLNYLNESRH